MKIATFNANSVRVRLFTILEWLDAHSPDVLALQETKVEDSKFPASEFREHGWHSVFHGQKSYNGVALLGKMPFENVTVGFCDDEFPEDYRVIKADIPIPATNEKMTLINTYVPNGSRIGSEKFAYKLRWLERFRRYLDENFDPKKPLIWTGDINIAPTPDDVYNSPRHFGKVGHHPEEFVRLQSILDWGLHDLFRKFHSGPGHYTFWEFVIPRAVQNNLGWRIDHIYGTAPLRDACHDCQIDKAQRLAEKPSDHTFVWAETRP